MDKPSNRLSNWIPTWPEFVRDIISSLVVGVVLSRSPALIGAMWHVATGSVGDVQWRALIPQSTAPWLLSVLCAVLIFAVLRAIAAERRVSRSSQAAHDSAIGGAMVSHEGPTLEITSPSGDLSDENDRDESALPPVVSESELRPGYILRFGMLWWIRYVPKRLTGMEALLSSFSRMFDTELRVEGPFCPNDYEPLQYKDSNGYRHMGDGDDVNWAGSPYCPICEYNERPDPHYRAARLLRAYREMVVEEFS